MMKLVKSSLGEITLEFKTGKTPPTSNPDYFGDEINWYTPTDLDREKILGKSVRGITKKALDDKKVVILKPNTILLGCIGDIGKIGLIKESASSNQQITGILPKQELVNSEFLYYWLKFNKNKLKDTSTSAIVPILNNKQLASVKIEYPEKLPDQIRIAQILSQAESLIAQRKQSISLLDELLKSTFLEMFIYNTETKKWNFTEIKNTVEKNKHAIKAGPFGSSLKKEFYVESGYKIYGQEQVIKDDLKFGNYYINEEKYKQLESCKIKEGDVLISLVGTYGKLSVIPKEFEPGIINPRLMKISFDQEIINTTFFKHLFKSTYLLQQLSKLSRGGTMDIINVGIVKEIKIPIPPIELQTKFANVVEKVETLKTQYQQSLTELQNMYGVLSQRAFKGELVLDKRKIKEKV